MCTLAMMVTIIKRMVSGKRNLYFLFETEGVFFVVHRCTVLTGVQMAQGWPAEEKTKY